MLDGPSAAPAPTTLAPSTGPGGSSPHEHSPVLVEMDFDVAGRAVREYACTRCPSVWFE